jgi:hypothetical protein
MSRGSALLPCSPFLFHPGSFPVYFRSPPLRWIKQIYRFLKLDGEHLGSERPMRKPEEYVAKGEFLISNVMKEFGHPVVLILALAFILQG